MAKVQILSQFTDGGVLRTTVTVDASFPDAVAEARATATAAHREMLDEVAVFGVEDDEQP